MKDFLVGAIFVVMVVSAVVDLIKIKSGEKRSAIWAVLRTVAMILLFYLLS